MTRKPHNGRILGPRRTPFSPQAPHGLRSAGAGRENRLDLPRPVLNPLRPVFNGHRRVCASGRQAHNHAQGREVCSRVHFLRPLEGEPDDIRHPAQCVDGVAGQGRWRDDWKVIDVICTADKRRGEHAVECTGHTVKAVDRGHLAEGQGTQLVPFGLSTVRVPDGHDCEPGVARPPRNLSEGRFEVGAEPPEATFVALPGAMHHSMMDSSLVVDDAKGSPFLEGVPHGLRDAHDFVDSA